MNILDVDKNWEDIQTNFQQICILRREGRHGEAVDWMRNKLSPLLASWKESTSADSSEKKKRLESLFQKEIQRVDDAWLTKDLLDQRLFQPFLDELKETLEPVLERRDVLQEPIEGQVPVSIATEFEVALEPLRSEIASLRQELKDLRESTESRETAEIVPVSPPVAEVIPEPPAQLPPPADVQPLVTDELLGGMREIVKEQFDEALAQFHVSNLEPLLERVAAIEEVTETSAKRIELNQMQQTMTLQHDLFADRQKALAPLASQVLELRNAIELHLGVSSIGSAQPAKDIGTLVKEELTYQLEGIENNLRKSTEEHLANLANNDDATKAFLEELRGQLLKQVGDEVASSESLWNSAFDGLKKQKAELEESIQRCHQDLNTRTDAIFAQVQKEAALHHSALQESESHCLAQAEAVLRSALSSFQEAMESNQRVDSLALRSQLNDMNKHVGQSIGDHEEAMLSGIESLKSSIMVIESALNERMQNLVGSLGEALLPIRNDMQAIAEASREDLELELQHCTAPIEQTLQATAAETLKTLDNMGDALRQELDAIRTHFSKLEEGMQVAKAE